MIQLKNVHKAFGPKRVLDGFTLDVPEGETMVIIGYSGTGKSVAIKHIVGLLEPDEGEVWVDGVNVPELSRRELYALRSRIGYVFQFAELFGGMRKRVGIARAIALRPKYILYDEPTTGLDPVTSAVIDQLMVRMREKLGVTGIVITHDMRSAYTVGTRIAMLYEGRVRWQGTIDEIQRTTDPVVRQFVEGKAEMEPGE